MTFGPHTVTHPILSQTSDEQADFEIRGSWARLCEEARRPLPIFAFPNGEQGDFGEREFAILRDVGFLGALTTQPDYVSPKLTEDGERFRLPRFGFRDGLAGNLLCVQGIERVKATLLGWIRS